VNAEDSEGRPGTIKTSRSWITIDPPAGRLKIFLLIFLATVLVIDSSGSSIVEQLAELRPSIDHRKPARTVSGQAPGRYQAAVPNSQAESLPGSINYEILDGWLKLGAEENVVLNKLGEPKKRKDTYWGALGTYVQEWEFGDKGITLQMESEDQRGAKTVRSISITAPCRMLTGQGVGIGSPAKMIAERYSAFIDKEESKEGRIVVGSIYGGTIFTLTDGKVSKIFIGAAAE
jgi:hypothetical protein